MLCTTLIVLFLHMYCVDHLQYTFEVNIYICNIYMCVPASPMIIYRKNMPFTRHNLLDDRRAMRAKKVADRQHCILYASNLYLYYCVMIHILHIKNSES